MARHSTLQPRWVVNVLQERPMDVDWRFISLRMVNHEKDYEKDFAPGYERGHMRGLELLRVAAAVRAELGRDAVLPLYTVFANAFGHQVADGERLPQKFFMWLINHTFWAGFKVFKTGAQMRLYNRSATKANIASYPVLEAASAVATGTVVSIIDGHTAFAWGEAFAEAVSAQGLSTEQIQQAYAQAPYWIGETVGENMCDAVLAGVRTGTPVIYRDLVSVTA